MKIVKPDDWAMLQVSGAVLNRAHDLGLPDPGFIARLGGRFFEVQARQPEPLPIAVSFVPSKRNERATSGDAWRRQSRTVRGLSCEGVCKLEPSDLHDLSYRRTGGNGQAFPTAGEFWNAFRSWASPEHGVCQLS